MRYTVSKQVLPFKSYDTLAVNSSFVIIKPSDISRKGLSDISQIADSFRKITGHNYLYNITSISNIPSIIAHGILCYDEMVKIPHISIAMDEVQKRRDRVIIPGGGRLHGYANLYFTYQNAMLYKRKDAADQLCILAFAAEVLDIKDCVVSDRNAAAGLVKFYAAETGIQKIDFGKVYAQYWTDDDPIVQSNLKQIKCAEILVPMQIPFDYVVGANVVSEDAHQKMLECGFRKPIRVSPQAFYRKEGAL